MNARIWLNDGVTPYTGYNYFCTIDCMNLTASHVAEIISRYSADSNVQFLFSTDTGNVFICEDEPADSYDKHAANIRAMLEEEPIRILWLSRHKMTNEQEDDLREIYGKITVTQVSENILSWVMASKYATCTLADVIAAALSPNIMVDLVDNVRLPVIRAVVEKIPTGKEAINPVTNTWETEYYSKYDGWEQIDGMKILTHRLKK